MSRDAFAMLSDQTVAEICRDFELQQEAKAHLSGEPSPEQFLDRLVQAELYVDAARFLAYALPEREAVWWACLCVRSVPACFGDEISTRALEAAEAWVKDPVDTKRQAALEAVNEHKFEMPTAPAAWAAMAAGWSRGSTATPDETVSPSGEHLTAHAVSGAIMLAATAEPDRAAEIYRRFLETGVQIAQGSIQISP